MSEQIHDPAKAEEMAYAEKPYRELEQHAKQLGVEHAASEMAAHADNAAYWAEHNFAAASQPSVTPEDASSQSEAHPPNSAEKELSREQLRELLKDSRTVGYLWFNSRDVPPEYAEGGPSGGQFKSFGTIPLWVHENSPGSSADFRALNAFGTPEELKEDYIKADVPEMLTVTSTNNAFGRVLPESSKANESTVILSYEAGVNGARNNKFKYFDGFNRPGNFLRLNILLPKSTADILIAAFWPNHPEIVREMVDMLMTEQVKAGQGWEERKPPYEQWREAGGGVSKMALRSSLNESPQQSYIAEF